MRFVPHFLSIVVVVCLKGLAPAQEPRLELFLQTGHTALQKKTTGAADLIIGKHSVVGSDAYANRLNVTAVAALTGEEGGGAPTDVSEHIEQLGNPLAQRYPDGSELHYARNISDLKAFDEKLYVGHGDWVVDSGPTDIWYYDLQKKEFVKQGQIEDEAADHYRVIDGRLYVPGTDPKEDWSLGNFYRLENEQWIKHRTLPGSIHCFDIVGVGDTLFATCTREIKQPPFLLASSDDGKTWKIHDIPENRIARRLFVIYENVYVPAGVAEAVPGGPESGDLKIYRFNGEGFDPCTGDIFPGAEKPARNPNCVSWSALEEPNDLQGEDRLLGRRDWTHKAGCRQAVATRTEIGGVRGGTLRSEWLSHRTIPDRRESDRPRR